MQRNRDIKDTDMYRKTDLALGVRAVLPENHRYEQFILVKTFKISQEVNNRFLTLSVSLLVFSTVFGCV